MDNETKIAVLGMIIFTGMFASLLLQMVEMSK
jgi:hypothetical protein